MFAAGKTSSGVGQTYVDDVFSTWLYTGNGSTQTITNGIDLAGKGGLVWVKQRTNSTDHGLWDTSRGAGSSTTNNQALASNSTSSEDMGGATKDYVSGFTNTGFSLASAGNAASNAASIANAAAAIYSSWTFRKAPKFFDVVTYTGTGANRTVAHSLGQVPGMIVVKRTDTTGDWEVYHRSLANTEYAVLNTTAAKATDATMWNSTTATASVFSLGTNTNVNASGGTYVAYLFAHDTATDGIIQCGSYTGTGATGNAVTLGWEPQYVLVKAAANGSAGSQNWLVFDTMRGMPVGQGDSYLIPNSSAAESTNNNYIDPTATGFTLTSAFLGTNELNTTYIYLAIRRPNKPPTTGTQVYNGITRTGTGANATVTGVGFTPDLVMPAARILGTRSAATFDRLRGADKRLATSSTAVEVSGQSALIGFDLQNGVLLGSDTGEYINAITTYINYFFRRAPGVFDEVCTGPTTNSPENHNLGVPPELIISKARSGAAALEWYVILPNIPAGGRRNYGYLNTTAAFLDGGTQTSTSTTFVPPVVGGWTGVHYLFATSPGISKVFSYTGNGSSQTINCGFTTGARFVLIKRTDSTGDWYVWDSARGIVAGNDPHLSLNTAAAEVTTDDSVDTDNTGFIVNQVAATNVNVTSATYIGLAFA